MRLDQRLNGIADLSDLEDLLQDAQLKVSVWSGRQVIVDGYRGSVRLVDLINKVYELVRKNPHFSAKERAYGKQVAQVINELYSKADHIKECAVDLRFKYACYFFSVLKDTSLVDDHILMCWEWKDHEMFKYYTKEQWERQFKAPLPCPIGKAITGRKDLYDPKEQMKSKL